jgi:dUTP pyrophosphatase
MFDIITFMILKIKKIHPEAVIPQYAKANDAGMDLYAVGSYEMKPGDSVLVKTGIAFEIPEGHAGLIWDRSGFSTKNKVKVLGGVIDAGYRGEIIVGLINLSESVVMIEPGIRVAQILIQKVEQHVIEVVEELSVSERGGGGFGSTGI